jgi:hypothetical protein
MDVRRVEESRRFVSVDGAVEGVGGAAAFDATVKGLVHDTGRRGALRALGAAGIAVIAARGLGESASAAQNRNRNGNDDIEAEGNKKKRRKRRRRRVKSTVVSGNIDELPVVSVIGDEATSVATCRSKRALLGCGYELSTSPSAPGDAAALQNTSAHVVPDAGSASCTATLTRTGLISGQIGSQARIQAFAVCED